MDINELNEITGLDTTDNDSVIPTSDKQGEHKCKKCPYTTDNKGDLLVHYRKEHPKEKIDDGSVKPIDTKTKQLDITHIPSDYENLDRLLKQWGVGARSEAVVEAMKYGEINDIQRLRELLIGAGIQANLRESIVGRWAEFQGLKVSPTGTTQPQPKSSTSELIDTLKEQMQLQALSKFAGGNDGSKENVEVAALKQQILEMKDLLLRQKQEQELAMMKEELRKQKEESENQTGHIASSMKEFSQSLVNMIEKRDIEDKHRWEMFTKERDFKEQLASLKEVIQGSKTENQYQMMEKLADKFNGTLNNMGSGFAELNKIVLKENASVEKADRAAMLLNAGMTPDQVTRILESSQNRPLVPSAQEEYRNLEKMTEQIQMDAPNKVSEPTQIPESHPQIPIGDRIAGGNYPPTEEVKFNASDQ